MIHISSGFINFVLNKNSFQSKIVQFCPGLQEFDRITVSPMFDLNSYFNLKEARRSNLTKNQ